MLLIDFYGNSSITHYQLLMSPKRQFSWFFHLQLILSWAVSNASRYS